MFGFLKDKLKKAIGAFSKGAETEVKEEKVEDKDAIEKAKQDEKKRISKATPKKPEPKPVLKPEAKKPEAKTLEPKKTKAEAKPAPRPEPKKPEPAKPIPQQSTRAEPKPAPKEKGKEEPRVPEKKAPEARPSPKPIPKEEPKIIPKIPLKAGPKEGKPKVEPAKQKAQEIATEVKEAPKQGFFSKLFGKRKEEKQEVVEEEIPEAPAPVVEEVVETAEIVEEIEQQIEDAETAIEEDRAYEEHVEAVADSGEVGVEEPKTGFFGKLKDAFTKKTLTPEKFDELFWELELAMLENNVAVEVIEKIKKDLRDELTSGKVSRMGIEDMITTRLRQSIEELFDVPTFDLVKRIKAAQKPYKICIIGINGSGKTTSPAKIIHLLKKHDLSVVVAASDTFRAAAIDQLKEHTDRLDVKLISQGYGADPAAVAFDAIKHAEAKGIDVVLIDTAGRLHSNTNLMQELEKVVRVAKPDLKIFVGESITGNDCVEQAQVFNKLVGIDAIILSKADIDEKGGAAISVSYVTGKPIIYLGMGQTYDDLVPFEKEKIIESLELE
jgi:fused signal recognition particle receptor